MYSYNYSPNEFLVWRGFKVHLSYSHVNIFDMLGASLDLTELHEIYQPQSIFLKSRVNLISLVFSDKPSNTAQAMSISF